MPTIRYSIIIPHKDIPNLLNRLLRSIPQREGYLREHGLFRYQQPIHDYLRKSTLSGAKVFFEFLRLARQYNAGLFSAFCSWLKSSLFSRHQQPAQQKETYITYLKNSNNHDNRD